MNKREIEKYIKKDLPRITYFLDMRGHPFDVEVVENHKTSRYRPFRFITVGLNSSFLKSRDDLRNILIHEVLHAKGVVHNRRARELGYSSIYEKDTLSPKVRRWIFNGEDKPAELEFLVNFSPKTRVGVRPTG